jgi:hypothetical protein
MLYVIFAALCLQSLRIAAIQPLLPPHEDEPFATEDHHEIELSIAESLLSRWILEGAPWNAYHSGLLFRNLQTNDTYVLEYVGRNFTSVMDALVPELRPKYDWQSMHGFLMNLYVLQVTSMPSFTSSLPQVGRRHRSRLE